MNTKVEEALGVLNAFRCAGYQQVCCGFPQGGGMNENGDGEPPECCGRPFDNEDLLEARTTLAAHIAQQDATIARLQYDVRHMRQHINDTYGAARDGYNYLTTDELATLTQGEVK